MKKHTGPHRTVQLHGETGTFHETVSGWERQIMGRSSAIRHGCRFDASGKFTEQRMYVSGQHRSSPGNHFSKPEIRAMESELQAAIKAGVENLPEF